MSARVRTALLLTLAVAVFVPAPAKATFPGADGKIAFYSDRDGNNEIYTMNPDVSGQTRLTTSSASDSDPAWSPDGSKIAFVSNRDGNFEIYKMNADGTGQTRVTSNTSFDADPGWSPDGTQIVFTSNRDGNNEIYKMNADGTGQTRLTNIGSSDGFPSWSPNGDKIAFQSDRDGNVEIYTMNTDGSGQTRLTNNGATDRTPNWSPDGARIAFGTDRDGNPSTYTMNADGSNQQFLNFTIGTQFPALSPSGGGLTAQYFDGSDFEILSNFSLTNNTAFDGTPDWQPLVPNHVRPVGATPLRYSLVPAYSQCTSPNTTHEAPYSFGSCVSTSPESGFLTVGTTDANGQPTKSIGSIRLDVKVGDPATPQNEADIQLAVSTKDVRNRSDLSDYTGGLKVTASLRATDKRNVPGSGYVRSGTQEDGPFSFAVPCTATADTTVGATCSVATTVNTLVAGAVVEGKRAVWQVQQIDVFDGGADGLPNTDPNTLFETEGVFIP